MGKRFLLLVTVIAIIAGFYYFWNTSGADPEKALPFQRKINPQASVAPATGGTTTIFVPYWSVSEDVNVGNYDRSVYFGITPTANGINKYDSGYLNMEDYHELFPEGEKLLAVRMLNSDLNLTILEDRQAQEVIVAETIETARQNGFSGVVLDFELSGLSGFFDEEVPAKINGFVRLFSGRLRQNDLHFAMTIYGDVFYRARPFDVKTLSSLVNEMMIMTYDFSKSRGEPGPNFPLSGKEKYGYDLKTLLEELTTIIPREKLTFIFGLYGYDWTVDEKKRPVKQAQALSNNEIKQKYLDTCNRKNCVILNDELSQETEIDFVDSANVAPSGFVQNHIVWFENLESAQKKQDYLRSQGIGNFAYWALGYF